MQSIINYSVKQSIKKYGIIGFYRDVSKFIEYSIDDPKVKNNIKKTVKNSLRQNWTTQEFLNNQNILYLLNNKTLNFDRIEKYQKLYSFAKDF